MRRSSALPAALRLRLCYRRLWQDEDAGGVMCGAGLPVRSVRRERDFEVEEFFVGGGVAEAGDVEGG